MTNFSGLGVNLQSFIKRMYQNLYYRSTSTNFLNEAYMSEARQAGQVAAVLDVTKQLDTTLTSRVSVDITTAITPSLATYSTVQINLTQLKMDYSFSISPMITTVDIANTLEGQIKLKEAQIAKTVDVFNYGKLVKAITGKEDGSEAYTLGQLYVWAPATQQDYIDNMNELKALLFNRNVFEDYRLGLDAIEYGKLTAALTSLLKFETQVGILGVEKGQVASAYGINIFPINTTVLTSADDAGITKGFFGAPVAMAGDFFFSDMVEYLGNYPGFPGYYVFEGNVLFGSEVIRPEAMIRLVTVASN